MDQSLRLLIIDDEEHVLANLCHFLNDKNYDVTSASDGLEGLKLFENDQQGFDLIITDIVMPKLSGMSLISIIKKKFPDTPVIAKISRGKNRFKVYLYRRHLVGPSLRFIPKAIIIHLKFFYGNIIRSDSQ